MPADTNKMVTHIWVVRKIRAPSAYQYSYGTQYLGVPKRHSNFRNYPYTFLPTLHGAVSMIGSLCGSCCRHIVESFASSLTPKPQIPTSLNPPVVD